MKCKALKKNFHMLQPVRLPQWVSLAVVLEIESNI
ncbi:MAG: hypothetical protein JWP81_3143 [Ferruginibacter sp.]|nr:hypothetical protein [Ferruginibacter sp.]